MHFLWFIVVQIASCDDSDTRAEFLSFSFEARKFLGLSMDVSFIDMQRQEKTGKSYLSISFKSVLGRSCTNFFFSDFGV